MSWLKPKVRDINPETVGNYFDQGGYVQEMGNLSRDLRDPNSEYNQGVLDNIRRGTEDSLFKRAIVNRRAAAASGGIGQSGILQQLHEQFDGSSWTETTDTNDNRQYSKGAGTQTAALVFAKMPL